MMPINASKAIFQVTAGVLSGEPLPEYTKRWDYTSDEYDKDVQTPDGQPTIFNQRLAEVHDYAMMLSNPAYVNWVHTNWTWV